MGLIFNQQIILKPEYCKPTDERFHIQSASFDYRDEIFGVTIDIAENAVVAITKSNGNYASKVSTRNKLIIELTGFLAFEL